MSVRMIIGGSPARGAVTLVEMLILTFAGLVVMAAVYGLLRRGGTLSDSTAQSLRLQVGARALLENMVRDIASCQQVLGPEGTEDPRTHLALVKPLSADPHSRLALNPDKAFPFVQTGNGGESGTSQSMEVARVQYVFDPDGKTVSRREEKGVLIASTGAAPGTLAVFAFVPNDPRPSERVLATSIERLAMYCVGYHEETGQPWPIGRKEDARPLGYEKTAVVAIRLKAHFTEGIYDSDPRAPQVEILTKVWSIKRRTDETHREYFSSTDEDLTW